jgi:hypothetical protein
MRTVVKIFLGVMLAGVVLIVGCFALVGYGLDEGVKEVERDQNRNAISNREARRVKIGTAKGDVIAKLGEPRDTQEGENEGLGQDSCIYYNLRGGEVLDSWQFCFDSRDRLTARNRS